MRCNNKLFQELSVINGKTEPYGSKGVLRQYHYRSDPELVPGIASIRIITCRCHAWNTILSFYLNLKIKEAVNHPIDGRGYNFKYS